MAAKNPPRPVFLNLAQIRFPVGAWASVGHRISGLVLAAALPFGVFYLQRSLEADAAFPTLPGIAVRVLGAVLAWAAAHHLFAGIRHLFMEVGVGSSLPAARRTAYAALVTAAAIGLGVLVT